MEYHNNTNKIHRLQLRRTSTALSDRHRHGITEPVYSGGQGREYTYPRNVTNVYSSTRTLTFVAGKNAAVVLQDGSFLESIPIDALDILGI
jgi:hypothetical protein